MLHESNVPRNSGYLVPCVFKAMRMIEALRETQSGLRVEDFRLITGYARSTIYRILRTLVACDYLVRNSGGYYRLNHAVGATVDASRRATEEGDGFGRHLSASDRCLGFERWGIQFRGNGTRMNNELRKTQLTVSQAAELEEDRNRNI